MMAHNHSRRFETNLARFALLTLTAAGISGCMLIELSKVRETEKKDAQYAYISGGVEAPSTDAEWMVVYIATIPCDDDWSTIRGMVDRGEIPANALEWSRELRELGDRIRAKARLAEHVVLQLPGFWYVDVAPGCYAVGAFADLNRNYKYDDEPAAAAVGDPKRLFELGPGDRREGIELKIDPDARLVGDFDPVAMQIRGSNFRSHNEQMLISLREVTAEGEIADLSDPRFGPKSANLGYFDIYRFFSEVGPGIYFLEPYDPDRIPVLFVHGALGFPQLFRSLIESLDRTRFQPWVFFYSSGSRLGAVATYLSNIVTNLQLRHGFEELVMVAHSMGGLVSRDFILRHNEAMVDDPVRVFVSISTPWDGVPSAEAGVEQSPFVVPSWRDVQPKSEFLASLFFEDPEERTTRRPLPDQVAFYLIFGVEDETVPVPSEVRWEAARDARERWPLVYDHTAILDSAEAAKLLNEILDREFP